MCTPECNLRCKYCFEESLHCGQMKTLKEIRSDFDSFLELYFRKFLEELIEINTSLNRRNTDITFHGGEPLLIGEDLLEKACRIVKSYPNTTIGMQTNSTLITDKFIEIFKKYEIQIGTSIDGPKQIHDAYRVNTNGKGSFDIVYKNIMKVKKAGVSIGALSTVTDVTVKHPEEFYDFFKTNDLDFSFNPCFTDPSLPKTYTPLETSQFIKFSRRMFDLWINDKENNIAITCFDRIISSMCVKKDIHMEVCSYLTDCSRTTVAITPTGDFYRCLHYCSEDKSKIGNIKTDSLFKALGDGVFKNRCSKMFNTVCKDCDIKQYCNGGCPYVSEAISGDIHAQPNTCACQKDIVHYIFDYYNQFCKGS